MRTTVIINDHVSRHRTEAVESLIKNEAQRRDITVRHSRASDDATAIARQAVAEGAEIIVAVGGDGTVNAVANAAVRTDVTVAVMPSGTANDWATFHHIPHNPADAWSVVNDHDTRRVDAISANGWVFLTGGGLGLPCLVAGEVDVRRHHALSRAIRRLGMGHGLYVGTLVHRLISGHPPCHHVIVRNGRGDYRIDAVAIVVSNQPVIGRYFRLSPDADVSDGVCDVCVIHHAEKRTRLAASIIKAARGLTPAAAQTVDRWRARELELVCEEPLPFMADGEIRAPQSGWMIRTLPGAIRLAVPKGQGH